MKRLKSLLIVFVVLFAFKSASAQNAIPLSKLIDLANCQSLNIFDTKVRVMGYSFEKKVEDDKSTLSIYTKRLSTSTLIFTLSLTYKDYDDNKPVISFDASSNVVPDYIGKIKQQATALKFTESTENCESDNENAVIFCYKSLKYSLSLFDIARREENNTHNIYKVTIFKK